MAGKIVEDHINRPAAGKADVRAQKQNHLLKLFSIVILLELEYPAIKMAPPSQECAIACSVASVIEPSNARICSAKVVTEETEHINRS